LIKKTKQNYLTSSENAIDEGHYKHQIGTCIKHKLHNITKKIDGRAGKYYLPGSRLYQAYYDMID
jgi:hypothetical protein